jgi:hypothetical protein
LQKEGVASINKAWRILIGILLALTSIPVFFLLMGVIPELIAWAFAASCLIWVILWPVSKVYELRTGRKIL